MTTIVTRAGKGSPLTHTEVDTNFTNLNTNKLEAGAIALGSAATPSISFTGDTNTGIYSPGADQVAVATNGTEKLIVLSNGNVGIGSSAPAGFSSNILHVNGATGSELHLTTGGTGAAAGDGLTLFTRDSDGAAGLFQRENASLLFGTNDNTRVTITSGGLVGIGTTSPTQKVQITDGTLSNFYIAPGYNSGSGTLLATGGSEYLAFATNGLTNERARIDSSGRLLVGTTSNTGSNTVTIQGNSLASTGGSIFQLRRGETNPGAYDLGTLEFADSAGSIAATIAGVGDGTWGSNDYPGRIVFSTTLDGAASLTERMRITNSGAILLGCTTAPNVGAASTVSGFAINGTGDDAYISMKLDNSLLGYFRRDGTDGTVFDFRKGNATVGSISVTASATAYNTSSDYRLKENVTAVTDGIARLQQLKPSRFNFKADPDKIVDGFIAHEAQAIVPECVTGTKDEVDDEGNPVYQGIDQSKLVPLLTAALQEAIAKIESLEARLTAAGIE